MRRAINRVALPVLLAALAAAPAFASVPSQLEVDARARAEGNRLEAAVALARVVIPIPGPAQILKVRIEGIGTHDVAGIMLEGRPKHPIGRSAFREQVAAIASASLAEGSLEEVDIWAIVPIPVPKGAIVSGPMAIPTSKTVFAATFRRGGPAPARKLLDGQGIYEEPQWAATLQK